MKLKLFHHNAIYGDKPNFEYSFLLKICLFFAIFSGIYVFLNYLGHLDKYAILIALIMFIYYTSLYVVLRKYKLFGLVKWLFSVFTVIGANLLWLFNYGSFGPSLFLLVVIYSLILFVFSGIQLKILNMYFLINIIALFILEYNYPELISNYPTNDSRIIDIYSAILFFIGVNIILINSAKKNYLYQFERAKRSDKLKTSFLENMSHEVRTPMNSIMGFSQLLNEDYVSDQTKKYYTKIIYDNCEALLRMMDDIVETSILESDHIKLDSRYCNIGKILKRLEKKYQDYIKLNNINAIEFILDDLSKDFSILVDAKKLERILDNLLSNAFKFTHRGFIRFGAKIEEEFIRFYVEDSGIGIHPNQHKAIFDRFHKVEDKKSPSLYRGTGIGLYLAKKLVDLMGGEIGIDSAIARGSSFYFTIPKHGFRTKSSEMEKKGSEKKKSLEGKKLLVVEDEESNLLLLQEILQTEKCEIIGARTGRQALDFFKDYSDIDLILIDIKLPEIDGIEVIKTIRKNNTVIPILAQTAYVSQRDIKECIDAGCNDYVTKPISAKLLIKKLKKHI